MWVMILVVSGIIINKLIDNIKVFYGIDMLLIFSKKVMIGVNVINMIKLFIVICISV